jgi:hypothetical protein
VFVPLLGSTADSHGWRAAAVTGTIALVGISLPVQLAMWPALPAPARRVRVATKRSPRAAGNARLLLITAAMAAPGLLSGALAAHLVVLMLSFDHPPGFSYQAAGLLGAGSVTGRLLVGVLACRASMVHLLVVWFLVQAGVPPVQPAQRSTWGCGRRARLSWVPSPHPPRAGARPLLIAEHLGPASFGTASATSSAVNLGMRAAGPAVMGAVVASTAGGYPAALLVLMAPLLLSVAALLLLGRMPLSIPADHGLEPAERHHAAMGYRWEKESR